MEDEIRDEGEIDPNVLEHADDEVLDDDLELDEEKKKHLVSDDALDDVESVDELADEEESLVDDKFDDEYDK